MPKCEISILVGARLKFAISGKRSLNITMLLGKMIPGAKAYVASARHVHSLDVSELEELLDELFSYCVCLFDLAFCFACSLSS